MPSAYLVSKPGKPADQRYKMTKEDTAFAEERASELIEAAERGDVEKVKVLLDLQRTL